jgi:hypothetical protein
MRNPKDGAAWMEVGPHNTIGLAMEDLPEVERRALEKELEEEMAEPRRHPVHVTIDPAHHFSSYKTIQRTQINHKFAI